MGMQGHERRHGHRFIMRVPLRFHATKEATLREESVSSMNISTHGVYFATDQRIDEGVLVQLHLKMPKEIVGDDVGEWSFTGRVAHVEPLSRQNGKSGVGVQFLFYEVPRPSLK
jgi:Tfp pilus assembly protein PilZ